MIENNAVKQFLESEIREQRIAGAAIRVRKAGQLVCDAQYGYRDLENRIQVDEGTIFRLASMTKPVIAVGVMRMQDEGLLSIEDPIEKYLPEFRNMRVSNKLVGFEDFYQADPDNPMVPKMNTALLEGVHEIPLNRPITIRDILSHSSGMGQGVVSMSRYSPLIRLGQTLEERVSIISKTILDFQPGENTGYSAAVAYEVLGRLLEIVSGRNLSEYITEQVCKPLGMYDTGYSLTDGQKARIAKLYETAGGELHDVTNSDEFWMQNNPLSGGYYSGSAGLLGTVADYDQFAQMLYQMGIYGGKPYLRRESVERMRVNGSDHDLEMYPGIVWGLGMTVTVDPERAGRKVGKGTFGWSGAYGTHFYIDPENELTFVLGINCSNIGGADSSVSKQLEEIVYKQYCQQRFFREEQFPKDLEAAYALGRRLVEKTK